MWKGSHLPWCALTECALKVQQCARAGANIDSSPPVHIGKAKSTCFFFFHSTIYIYIFFSFVQHLVQGCSFAVHCLMLRRVDRLTCFCCAQLGTLLLSTSWVICETGSIRALALVGVYCNSVTDACVFSHFPTHAYTSTHLLHWRVCRVTLVLPHIAPPCCISCVCRVWSLLNMLEEVAANGCIQGRVVDRLRP